MKNHKHILISILLITVICYSFCSCVPESSISQAESLLNESMTLLVAGDFTPVEEAFITYEKALEEYKDPFIASLAGSAPKEARMVPQFDGDITQIRISVPKRPLVLDSDKKQAYQIYYGYLSDGKWCDIPADNYDLKTLSDLDSGHSDGWDALTGDHVVKMGPYLLLGLYSPIQNSSVVKDSLNSQVLTFTADSLTEGTEYEACQIYENALAGGTENYDYFVINFGDRHYIALEYDKIPTNYTVTVTLDFGTAPMDITYTYDDIMEALNRE